MLKRSLEKLALPNVWFDLAALCLNSKPETFPYPTARGYIRDATDIAGTDRLLWGSDMPSAMTRDSYRHFIGFIAQDPGLSETDKVKIHHDNAEALFFPQQQAV